VDRDTIFFQVFISQILWRKIRLGYIYTLGLDLIALCIVGKIFIGWVFSLGHDLGDDNDWAKDLGGHVLGKIFFMEIL